MDDERNKTDSLREKALKTLEERGGHDDASLYHAKLEDLVQELSVYQIEIEHQNDELKKTQAQLEASRNRLFDLYHHSPAGYATITENYEIEEINLTACRMLGVDEFPELIGKRFTRFIMAEDQDTFYFHLKNSLTQPHPQSCELRLVAENREKPVVVRLESVRESPGGAGGPGKIRSSIMDITRAKEAEKFARESEQRFIETADLLPDAVFETDRDMYVTYANQAMSELFGFSPGDLEKGIRFLDLFHPGDRQAAEQRLARKHGGEETGAGEYRFLTKSGHVRVALFNESLIIKDNVVIGMRASLSDLTERKQLQKQADRARKIESIGMLAANIAHEFNNLFTSVYGHISLAKMDLDEAHAAYQALDKAEQSMDSAKELTGRLLTFSRGGNPVIEKIDPAPVVQEILDKTGLEAQLEWQRKPWPVLADANQLRQMIAHIVANAKEAMGPDGHLGIRLENVRISKGTHVIMTNGNYVRISFQDNGAGITKENLERIFDPYFTTKNGAAGLGLPIVHSIATRHRGHMELDSKPGEGTMVTVYLPAAGPSGEAAPDPDESHSAGASS